MRERQRHGAEDGLRALIAADPYPGESQAYPHLFVFARAGVRRTEMFRDAIGADQNWQPLLSLLTGVINDVVRPMYTETHRGPQALLETLIMGPPPDHRGRRIGVVATRRTEPGRRGGPPRTQNR